MWLIFKWAEPGGWPDVSRIDRVNKIMTRRILITIEYDGARFVGWQRQENGDSVQATLEAAAEAFIGTPTPVVGAGRTDSGVHATGQVAHLDVPDRFDANRVMQALNAHLGEVPVTILHAREVVATIHARFSATARRYIYRILPQRQKPALNLGRVWHHRQPLDSDRMHKAAQSLIGRHDFTSFRASQCQAESPVRTLDKLNVEQVGNEIISMPKPAHFCIIRCVILPAHWRLLDLENGMLWMCNKHLPPVTVLLPDQRPAVGSLSCGGEYADLGQGTALHGK